MRGTRATAARPGTRTPDALATPSTPPAIEQGKSGRERKPTSSYAQQQEEEQERRVIQSKHRRSLASTTLGGNTAINTATGTDQSQASQEELQDLLSELKKLREELRLRDTKHEEEVQRIRAEFKEALAEVRRELKEVKGGLHQASSTSWSCSGHDEIIQELQSLRSVITTPTTAKELTALQDDDARINKIMEENEMGLEGFRISQISWLRKDKEKAIGKHGSLGIWFDTREAAEWLMDRGLLRKDATGVKGSATWHGHAKNKHDADTVQEITTDETARQG
ncbi:Hypothetical protein PENO1_107760 [Penicillium occitanis (nom. inval.)]|nr:Hypothetical protein PENO1_107760 [Penicillium occitanis (nom. inval.)]PCG89016.1 hypothetical protein PENOC_108390 [Penicillium occitanis (nom. inval.)]